MLYFSYSCQVVEVGLALDRLHLVELDMEGGQVGLSQVSPNKDSPYQVRSREVGT